MARISVRGNRLYAGERPWRAWGMNWGLGDHAPVIAYFNDPSSAHLALLATELRTARAIGANSMRIYLQLDQVMATPTQPRQRTLTALRRLLALAQADGIYLDITGDLVWQPAYAPGWYARMGWRARWQVQARFWKAVAHAAAGSPAVLCYELTSEPIVAPTPAYYYGQINDWWFVQSIATAQGPAADALARSWTRLLAGAVRSQDDRPISIGLLPVTTGPFAPSNISDLLDMLIIHEYPTTGQAPAAVSLIHAFAAFHKPLLLGETFMLTDDARHTRSVPHRRRPLPRRRLRILRRTRPQNNPDPHYGRRHLPSQPGPVPRTPTVPARHLSLTVGPAGEPSLPLTVGGVVRVSCATSLAIVSAV